MQDLLAALRLCPRALLLQDEAYLAMRELASPFLKGLVLLLVVGILVSAVTIAGETLEWATTPDLAAMKDVVLQGLERMDWYQKTSANSPSFESTFRQQYDMGWRIVPYLFGVPNPIGAAVGVITIPLWLGVSWLLFGLLGYLFGRLLGGQATLDQTLGCTALAVAPQLLGLARLLPYVEIGGAITIWTLLCNYLALRNAQRLSSGRAFWATLLPFILLILLTLLLLGGLAAGLELTLAGGAR